MQQRLVRRALSLVVVPLLVAAGGCDIVSAGFGSEETAQWQKTYTLAGERPPRNQQQERPHQRRAVGWKLRRGDGHQKGESRVSGCGEGGTAAHPDCRRTSPHPAYASRRNSIPTRTASFSRSNWQVEYRVKVPASADVKLIDGERRDRDRRAHRSHGRRDDERRRSRTRESAARWSPARRTGARPGPREGRRGTSNSSSPTAASTCISRPTAKPPFPPASPTAASTRTGFQSTRQNRAAGTSRAD